MLMQVISVAGAVMVLGAFAALQLGKLKAETYPYQLLNLGGGFCLFVAALPTQQLGLIAVEGAWALLAAGGLWKVYRSTR